MAEGGVLPPAIQQFIANSEGWIAGIDEMIAADDRLLESIAEVKAAAEEAGLAAGEAGEADAAGADAGAGAAAAGESAEAADAATEAQTAEAAANADVGDTAAAAAEKVTALADGEKGLAGSAVDAVEGVAALGDAVKAGGEASLVAGEQLELFSREDLTVAETAGIVAEAIEAQARAAGVMAEVMVAALSEIEGSIAAAAESAGLYVDATGRMRQANGAVIDSALAARDALAEEGEAAGMSAEELRVVQAAAELAAESEAQLAETAGILTDAMGVEARAVGLNADADKALAAGNAEAGASADEASGKFKMMGLALLVGAAVSIKMAADFQQSMTRLVTSAGESESQIGMLGRGILALSVSTDTSAQNLAQGLYYISSAGYTGAKGLIVLKAAAEGAQAEQASLTEVSDALTTAMVAYHEPAAAATAQMDQMIVAVSRGKTTLQNFASSLATVLPIAATAKLSFAQVGGAMATMTAQGMSARQSALDLRHTIMSLENPNNVQIAEMQQLGINSIQLSKNLGHEGLTGTLDEVSEAILHNMGPSGLVLLKSFNQSKLAAQSAQEEIQAMPPSIAKLASSYANGTMTVKAWNAVMFSGSIPAKFKNLLSQFATTENTAKGFNATLKAGGGDAQTFTAALSKVTGGVTGSQVAMMLGGKHAVTFADNVKAVGAASKGAGQNISTWGDIQKNFNFQLGSADKSIISMAISLGQTLLPAATGIIKVFAKVGEWFAHTAAASKALAVVIGVVLAVAFERTLAKGISGAGKALSNLGGDVKTVTGFFRASEGEVSGFSKLMTNLGNVGKGAWSMLKSAWSGLTGIFRSSTEAAEAQTTAQDAQAASADVVATSTEAASAGEDVLATSSDTLAASEDVAAVSAGALDIALSPIILIVLAIIAVIAGLVIGFVLLWKHCAAFRDFWKDMWRDIEAGVAAAVDFIKAHWQLILAILLGPIGIAVDLIARYWRQITEGVADVIDFVKAHWELLLAILIGPIAIAVLLIVKYWRQIMDGIDDVIDWIKGHWELLLEILVAPIAAAVALITGHWNTLQNITQAAWNALVRIVQAAWTAITGLVKAYVTIMSSIIKAGLDVITGIWDASWDIIKGAVTIAWQVISDTVRIAIDLVTGIIETGIALITGHWSQAGRDLENTTSQVFGQVRNIIHSIVDGFANILFDAGEAMIRGLINGVESMVGALIGTIRSLGSDAESALGDVLHMFSPSRVFYEHGRNIVLGLVQGITENQYMVTDALRRLGVSASTGQYATGAAGTAAAGGQQNLNVTVNLSNSMSGAAWQHGLQQAIQSAVLDYSVRNPGTGLVLPVKGRA